MYEIIYTKLECIYACSVPNITLKGDAKKKMINGHTVSNQYSWVVR